MEHGRPRLPPQVSDTPSRESSQDDGAIESTSRNTAQGEVTQGTETQEAYFVPIPVCQELMLLLTKDITADQLKAGSKEFPLSFGHETSQTAKIGQVDYSSGQRKGDC